MQLWKKNFLATYLLFLIVIYGGLMLLDVYISKNELVQWNERAVGNEKSIFYLTAGLKDEEFSRQAMNLEKTAKQYQEIGIYLKVTMNGQIMADSLPFEIAWEGKTKIIKQQGEKYLVLSNVSILEGTDVLEIIYAENLKPLSEIQMRRMKSFCITGAAFSLMIGFLLYHTMKRINRPVNQIAHELRTPLTGIRGYAEYMMLGNLTKEEQFFASKQIAESAKNLEEIVEKLLIMGNLKEGTIHKRQISMEPILKTMIKKYPDIELEWNLETLNADKTLLTCLLDNLVANAVHAGNHIKIKADSKNICIWNDGDIIDKPTLKAIHKKQDLTSYKIGKHGYGIRLCQEIASIHGWKLFYQSKEGEGTSAILILNE